MKFGLENIKRIARLDALDNIVKRKSTMKQGDTIHWDTKFTLMKFYDPDNKIAELMRNGYPTEEAMKMAYKTEVWHHNVALAEGLAELIDLICGIGGTAWDSTNAFIGVGDSNTAASSADTTLLAAANKTWKAMDSTYPKRSGSTIAQWRSTFASGDANYAWEEYVVCNVSDGSGKDLNRKVSSKGTKASGESWTLEIDITFS